MPGPALSGYVVASASDGYQVVFSLGELDPDMTDGQYLLADKANGKALFGETGAFRLVVPKDKRGARSIRMLTTDAHPSFFNTGLHNLPGELSYPAPNTGLHQFTKRPEDIGKFRVPTLRNIAVTAPYMHDGSVKTLSEVIDHYAAVGRTITLGAYAGVGHDNLNKAPNAHGFSITAAQKSDLIAFLESLTDSAFLHNPALSNPWKRRRRSSS